MPRQPRLDAPGALHHVMGRGLERTPIFANAGDRADFLGRLADLCGARALSVYAWALLPNHFHLLVRTGGQPLAQSMKKLLTGYVVNFNRHPRSPLARRRSVALRDLERVPFVLYREDFALHGHILDACRRAGFTPKVASESSQWDFMAAMVAGDVGVALLPQTICRRLDAAQVTVLPLAAPELRWDLALVWKRGRHLPPAARAFVEVVRRHLETLPTDRVGLLAGLRDPHVGKALAAMHARPGDPWTLDWLGHEAGLSRSALAEHFAALVGEPPIQYLARWRMQVAAGLLATTHEGIAAIGARVGYASEASFSRAFKKLVGVPPAAWRRRKV